MKKKKTAKTNERNDVAKTGKEVDGFAVSVYLLLIACCGVLVGIRV